MSVWNRGKEGRLQRPEPLDQPFLPENLFIELKNPTPDLDMAEDPNNNAPLARLQEYFIPSEYTSPSCIQLPNVTAAQYEIKPSIIQLLPSFYGNNNEDPYNHIDEFHVVCRTVKINNFSEDALKLTLFPFSLKDKAKHWLSSLQANSFTTWPQLQREFLKKYFSSGKTNQYRRAITSFAQLDGEQFHETWERLQELIRKCPHHKVPKWQLVQCFYDGLCVQQRQMVDASCGGTFMLKNEDEAWELFENLSENSQHHASAIRNERGSAINPSKPRGLYEVKPSNDIHPQVAALAQQLTQLLSHGQSSSSPSSSQPSMHQEACALCYSPTHFVSDCPAASQFPEFVHEQVNAAQGFPKPINDPFSNTYNPGWHNHPNFSWRSQPQGNSFAQPQQSNPRCRASSAKHLN